MEELKFEIETKDFLELRCRDSCPCGYMDTDNNEIPLPKNFK